MRWLSRIFNRNLCVYQTGTRWDLPPYRITIWLTDWWCNVCLFTWWIDSRFLLEQPDMENRWIWIHIIYHPCITSGPTNAHVKDVVKIIFGKQIDVLYRGFKTTITDKNSHLLKHAHEKAHIHVWENGFKILGNNYQSNIRRKISESLYIRQ